jgi:HPt (histidine-containing phosphotransfer) domain-containing protein
MNAHVAKPIDPKTLFRVMAAVVARPASQAAGTTGEFSLEGMIGQLGMANTTDLARTFLESGDEVFRRLIADCSGDLDALERASHEFRGLAAYSGLDPLELTAAQLHQAVKDGDRDKAKVMIARLQTEWIQISTQLSRRFGLDPSGT